jgi:hypothetical protein
MKTETKDIFELLGIPNLPKTSDTFREINDLDSLAKMHLGYKSVYRAIREDCVAKIEELNLKIATADRLIEMTAALEVLLKKDKPAVKKSSALSQPQLNAVLSPTEKDKGTSRITVVEATYHIINLFASRAPTDDIQMLRSMQISNLEIKTMLGKSNTYLFNLYSFYKDELLIEKGEKRGNDRYWQLTKKGADIVRQIIHAAALGQPLDVYALIKATLSKKAAKFREAYISDKSRFLLAHIAKKNNKNLADIRVNVRELIEASIAANKAVRKNAPAYVYNWIHGLRYIGKTQETALYKLTEAGIEAIKSITNE